MRKSQAAIEFLTTYGWAIMVVILSISVLTYYGLLDINRYTSDYCTITPQLVCKDYSISSNSLSLLLENDFGFPIQIINISILQDGVVKGSYEADERITPGKCLPITPGADCEDLDRDSCIGNIDCKFIPGYIDIDDSFLLNINEFNRIEQLQLQKTSSKQEVDLTIYFRRIDEEELENTGSINTPIHVVHGSIFTIIK